MRTRVLSVRLLAASAMLIGGGLAAVPAGASSAGAAPTVAAAPVKASVFTLPLTRVGEINLAATAAAQKARSQPAATATPQFREVDNKAISRQAPHGTAGTPSAAATPLSTTNVKGESGFNALNGVEQANTSGGLDLEPPDQGLCAGNGYVMEFINNALAVYDQHGNQVVAPIGSPSAFLQPTSDFFSDPRCYFDQPTQRWFYQEFIVGTVSASGKVTTPSTEFEAVSNTSDPTGSYTIWSWNTTDAATNGCPCFGDYDQLGADDNGIYVATDEFGINTPAFNGTIIYAISKETLETVGQTGIVPPVFAYRLTADPFGQPYIVAPTSTPPGATFARNTEYFVESNSNRASDDRLVVYALRDTSQLATPAAPNLYRTTISTESYSFPPDAKQKPGARPLGHATQDPEGQIEADFNAEMEPTYVGGHIYAELDTGTSAGTDGVDWFILTPSWSHNVLSASVAHQGLITVRDTSLLYPYTAVNSAGVGYLLFSLSGVDQYPSPAYISYNVDGPTGPVIVATPGAAPDDGFTCYAAYVGPNYGGCRWGDYSQGVVMGSRVYMAAEMIPSGTRDTLTNWGTFIWSAPPPVPAP